MAISGTKMQQSFLYGEVEVAIAKVLEIWPIQIGALRARLQHLRNLGLPAIPKTGSGRKVNYSYEQALEMLIAMALENNGLTPRLVIMAVNSITSKGFWQATSKEEVYMLVTGLQPVMWDQENILTVHCQPAKGRDELLERLAEHRAALFINLSALAMDLKKALAAAS